MDDSSDGAVEERFLVLLRRLNDERGEREVEDSSELVQRWPSEFIVDAVLQRPHNDTGEDEEGGTNQPEVLFQGLDEDPKIVALFVAHRHHHRHPGRHSPTSAGTYSNRSAYGSCRTAASNTSITNPPAVVRFVAASVSMFLNLWYAGSAGLGTAILSTAPLVGRSHPFGSTVDSPGHITPASPSPLRLSRRDSPCCGVQNPISLALSPITFTTRNAVTFSSPSTSRNFPPRPSNSVSSSSFSSSGPVLDTRKFAISVGPVPAPTYAGPTGPSRSAAAATAHAASYAHKA
ncbi:hypothetical protein ACMD2_25604 [Ananas comosus]|uniref:Uncharacterized protein n=1 Tax=Ananas comosus TaxID=4615 RepID=A0A199UP64_ANACO|nr:hypothetical protein ACMD2_25604 [Ananas comosus]